MALPKRPAGDHAQIIKTSNCNHADAVCINPYELIRKYACGSCDALMMCACDEAFGRRFLAHQLREGTVLESQQRIPVTLGFQPAICPECRGLPAQPAPRAPSMGATSKIKRYYWRELFFEEMRRFDDWEVAHPDADEDAKVLAQAEIAAAVLAEIKALHEASPKYVYTEVSDQEVLTRYKVEIENLTAEYAPKGRKGAIIQVGDEVISPEAFAIEHYRAQGLEAIPLESVPFMSLFAVMMALVICDTLDDQVRFCGFGNRDDYEAGRPCRQIWASLPEDFGKPTYADRRAAKLKRFFAELPDDRFTLLWTYDYFRGVSYELRQYLWVHKDVDFDRGRMLIERLSPAAIVKILQYLIGDYWGRHLGWPDLLVLGGEDGAFFLAEVKSSKDSLSEEQKRWIADNDEHLGFPFRIVKIHRSNPDRKASASTRT